ncbi:MAG: hypothetical protein ACFFAS_08925 [Promethearchaeota archaeon]
MSIEYLLRYDEYEDIFSSLMRMELLVLITAFIETLLKRTINSKDLMMNLINQFNPTAYPFQIEDLNDGILKKSLPSYGNLIARHPKTGFNSYTNHCDFILGLKGIEQYDSTKIDISSPEKLRIFQASLVCVKTRNTFHHDLNISSVDPPLSIRDDIPIPFKYLSKLSEFKKIYDLILFYLCGILKYAFNV